MDTEKENGFKKAFDKISMNTIEEIHFISESFKLITKYVSKISFLLYDICMGNKTIKKTKDGNIMIIDTDKLHMKYQEQIDELKKKLKKYEVIPDEKPPDNKEDSGDDKDNPGELDNEFDDSDSGE